MKTLFTLVLTLITFSLVAQEKNQFDSEGKRHGYWTKNFDITDQKRYEGQFDHGKETGTFSFYTLKGGKSVLSATKDFDKATGIATVKFLSSKGKLISEGKMKGRLYIGPWVYYHNKSDAILSTENYNDAGKLQGEKIVYYESGKIAERVIYKDGKIDGLNVWYSENGKVLKEMIYVDGNLHGLSKYYNPEGIILAQGHYRDGMKNGIWKYFEDGVLKEEKDYTIRSKNPKKRDN